mgnify:FL=1
MVYKSAAPGTNTSAAALKDQAEPERELTPEEEMARVMGFAGFASTHGKQVESNVTSAARGASYKVPERKFRQYMNRRDGFNRPIQGSGTSDR